MRSTLAVQLIPTCRRASVCDTVWYAFSLCLRYMLCYCSCLCLCCYGCLILASIRRQLLTPQMHCLQSAFILHLVVGAQMIALVSCLTADSAFCQAAASFLMGCCKLFSIGLIGCIASFIQPSWLLLSHALRLST